MLMVAIGWHMYTLTNSAWDLGLVGLCQFLPALVLTLPAGMRPTTGIAAASSHCAWRPRR